VAKTAADFLCATGQLLAIPLLKTASSSFNQAIFPAASRFTPRIEIRCRRRNGFCDKKSSSGYQGFPGLSSKMERMIHIPSSKPDQRFIPTTGLVWVRVTSIEIRRPGRIISSSIPDIW
jgi:hypothetical protein